MHLREETVKKKPVFYTEAAYVFGILLLALGTALMEKADFGMSMVVAPAYLIYLKASGTLPWFSFGMAEYCFQALLLILLAVRMRRFRVMYLFSFVTAVIYGLVLDGMMSLTAALPAEGLAGRAVWFLSGLFLCAVGVALLFRTYIAPEAYELVVSAYLILSDSETKRRKVIYLVFSIATQGGGYHPYDARFAGLRLGHTVVELAVDSPRLQGRSKPQQECRHGITPM